MKTEDRLEEQLQALFRELVDDEPPLTVTRPVTDRSRGLMRAKSWSFQGLLAKGALAKGFAGAALAGAVAVGAVVAPQLAPDDRERTPALVQPTGGSIAPSGSPSATSSPSPRAVTTKAAPATRPEDTLPYRDERIGVSLAYPKNWTEEHREDVPDYVAFVAPHEGDEPSFVFWQQRRNDCVRCLAVPIQLMNFAEHDEYMRIVRRIADRWRDQGVLVTEGSATVAGRRARTYHVQFPDRPPVDPNDQEWCRGCRGDWFLVPWYHNTTLDVRVVALDGAAYRAHARAAREIVDGMRDVGPPSERLMPRPPESSPEPDPTPTATQPAYECTPTNGAIMSEIRCDAITESVLRFAAKRIDGSGATRWLSTTSKFQYDSNEGGLWLYTPEGERPYKSYFVTERKKMEDGTVRFTLEMNQGFVGDEPDRIRTEHVFLAAGGAWNDTETPTGIVVKRAALVDGPTEGTSPT